MVKVTDKNRRDLEMAKRFFEGKTFAEIKEQIEYGCFKNAKVTEETKDLIQIRFQSLVMQMSNSEQAVILPYVLVYDENDIISGSWNIEEVEQKKTNLDSVREWLKENEEKNVRNILIHIRNNFPHGWNDFIAEEINNRVNNLTPAELPDSLYQEIIDDWKGENEEKVIEEWLQNESYRSIAEKICFEIDGKEVAKEIIDEL